MAKPLNSKPFESQGKKATPKGLAVSKKKNGPSVKSQPNRQQAIPKAVANRMARRVAFTTGLPTITGMGVFVASYLLVTRGIADIPPVLTLISSAACFIFGLLGLSYGLFSASWDEKAGTLLGLENIRPNIRRMRDSIKASNK